MATWLLKTEPTDCSFADLQREQRSVWDGVTNNLALKHIRNLKQGDRLFIYHTGAEKSLVGLAQAASNPYPDPKIKSERMVVFDVVPVKPLNRQVPLAEIKADARFKDFPLVRLGRLSVMPVPLEIEAALLKMAGEEAES